MLSDERPAANFASVIVPVTTTNTGRNREPTEEEWANM